MTTAPVPDEPAFAAPWQAQAYAMTLSLVQRGQFTWSEWTAALTRERQLAPDHEYFQHWLATLEKMVLAKGISTGAELNRYQEAWDRAAHRTPHGAPITLSEVDLHG